MRALVASALLLFGCSDAAPRPSHTVERGEVSVTLDADGVLVVRRAGVEVARTHADGPLAFGDASRAGAAYAGFASAVTKRREVRELFGFSEFDEEIAPWSRLRITDVTAGEHRLTFAFDAGGGGEVLLGEEGAVHVGWELPLGAPDRLAMSFSCAAGERIFGLGAQVSAEHRGHRVPVWTNEQGVGKTERGEPTGFFGFIGAHYDSYAPVPFALSTRPLGVWLDSTHRSEFELCEADRALRIEGTGPRFDLHLFPAESMAGALEAFTARTGRPEPVSRWTFAPWIDTFGGPEAIADALAKLREHEIPASALWSEDWVGTIAALGGENLTYDWEEDPALYPDLAATAASIHGEGLRFLTYLNPFIPDDTAVHAELAAAGALVRDEHGEEIVISFPFGAPPAYFDPTSAQGVLILRDYQARAEAKGVDGWMADYGEGLPFEAVLSDGRSGAEAHNDYPLLWARENQQFWTASRPDGDFAIFSRSGFTGIAADTHVHWLGDQLTSFDRNDGFGSVAPLYLSAGLSGIALTHSDVGGYTAVPGAGRTYELWARWLAFEAFTPILRTHHSSAPDDSVQWWSSEETLALFNRYARWHQRLLPYFVKLGSEAHARGYPPVRPVWWGAEERTDLLDVADQVLVGPDLLLAPVLSTGASGREVRLPPGVWRRWTDLDAPLGEGESGDAPLVVAASVGEPVLFVRAGAAIALLREEWRSVAPRRGDRVVDDEVTVAPDRIEELRLMLVAGGEGVGELEGQGFAGARWTWDGQKASPGPVVAVRTGGSALPACSAGTVEIDCVESGVARLGPGSLAGGALSIDTAGGSGVLTFQGEGVTRVDLEVR